MADKKEPTEDIIENERLEDEEALETVPSEDKIPDKKPKKKKNKKKKDLPASQPTNAVTSMKELFSKLGLEEEKKKSYPFWETQPVPKIGWFISVFDRKETYGTVDMFCVFH